MQNPNRHLLYKVLLLSTISILTCGIIQSSPKISLIELDCITIYNGINQTPQDENLSWEAELKQDAKKARERKAAERAAKAAADKKLREAAADKKLREAAAAEKEKQRKAAENENQRKAAEKEKQRIAAEKEKQRIAAENEKQRKEEAERAAKAAADKKLIEAKDEKQTYKYLSIFLFAVSILSVYLYNRNRKLQKDIEKQEKDISIVKEDLTKTKQELIENKFINATINQHLIENRDIIATKDFKDISKVVEIFYMSTPNPDGSFSIDSKHTNYDPTSCYYEFENTGDNLYEFVLIDEAAPKALKYPDRVIDPVCDSIEGSSRNSQKIITVTKGKAELDGSMLRVIEKSQIKYTDDSTESSQVESSKNIKEKKRRVSRNENSTIEILQANIRELEQNIQNLQTLVLHTQQKYKEGKLSNEHHAMSNQSEKMFYMSIPNQDGTFSHTAIREKYDPTSCFYTFVNNEDGSFLFKLEEGSLNLALKYPHKIIDPVCDIVDGSLQHSSNVDIVRYGKAVQSNDTFKVIEKMKIRVI